MEYNPLGSGFHAEPTVQFDASNNSSSVGSFIPPLEIFMTSQSVQDEADRKHQDEEAAQLAKERRKELQHQEDEKDGRTKLVSSMSLLKSDDVWMMCNTDWKNKVDSLGPSKNNCAAMRVMISMEKSSVNDGNWRNNNAKIVAD
uniref:Uncharacterized protein n=1 Tax=Oryza brachyantha TaxID=4533 RepID=J3L139_ORYBR